MSIAPYEITLNYAIKQRDELYMEKEILDRRIVLRLKLIESLQALLSDEAYHNYPEEMIL